MNPGETCEICQNGRSSNKGSYECKLCKKGKYNEASQNDDMKVVNKTKKKW